MASAGTGIAASAPLPARWRPAGIVSPAVSFGLLVAWVVHDLEEVPAFGPRGSARHAASARAVSRRSRSCLAGRPTGRRTEFAVAIGIVGVVMAAAGQARGGRWPGTAAAQRPAPGHGD
jgi:hypothetical protein